MGDDVVGVHGRPPSGRIAGEADAPIGRNAAAPVAPSPRSTTSGVTLSSAASFPQQQKQPEPGPPLDLESEFLDPLAESYAEEHLRYLKEAMPHGLRDLEKSGELAKHLISVGNEASLVEMDLMRKHHLSREVQNLPDLQRIRELQSRLAEVQELVRHDMIHQPTPD